jgi:hypothetical protein
MAKGVISDRDVRSYQEDGFVIVRNFLNADEINMLGRAAREDRVLDQHSFVPTEKAAPCGCQCGIIQPTQFMGPWRARSLSLIPPKSF